MTLMERIAGDSRSRGIILDLCGGTGSWSAPYLAAGYDVRLVTLPALDVRKYRPPANVHGILAAPPCTTFSIANNMRKRPRSVAEKLEGVEVVCACLRIILMAGPKWWALENPVGYLSKLMGPPVYSFQPWRFGDPWTKRTLLWGKFAEPRKRPVPPLYAGVGAGGLLMNGARRKPDLTLNAPRSMRAAMRAVTPPGFARAFYEANP